jgi:predicted DNA-binding transcriptional regulator AlpA
VTQSLPEREWLPPSDVSAIYGQKLSTLQYWRQIGVGPIPIRIGRGIRYRRSDWEQWVQTLAAQANEERLRLKVASPKSDEL